MVKLASGALAIPITSADCERGFSTQNRIKRAHRSTVGIDRLNVLMRISMEGPPIDRFDFVQALAIWRQKKHRIVL